MPGATTPCAPAVKSAGTGCRFGSYWLRAPPDGWLSFQLFLRFLPLPGCCCCFFEGPPGAKHSITGWPLPQLLQMCLRAGSVGQVCPLHTPPRQEP